MNIAVVGATGHVGEMMLKILIEKKMDVNKIYPLASHRSEGKTIELGGCRWSVKDVAKFDFSKVNVALFSAGSDVAKKYGLIASKQNCVVIDNSSCYRYDKDVPLIIPEINKQDIPLYKNKNIIANPNCSTIQMLMALKTIDEQYHLKRIIVSTYQSVSGSGQKGMEELEQQIKSYYNGKKLIHNFYSKPILFNAIPHIDVFLEDGSTKEEWKMKVESKKILHSDVKIHANCVRIPSMIGHGEFINVETERDINIDELKKRWEEGGLVKIVDHPDNNEYATPQDSILEDRVLVSRVRKDSTIKNGISFWCVANNLRKGAALNAVEIVEILEKDYL